eukprot:c15087_g1_i1.p1 GENE.c15087_g1_i1~~c15087_g1_i1.p1  ORF type:complete len:280 (+),score=51.98 c15087_g1_i1:97-840(+)
MTLVGILNELCSRFILNCPPEELDDVRVMFNVELAHWYYLDHEREQDSSLPGFGLKDFTHQMFNTVAALRAYKGRADELYGQFMEYKQRVPVYGAILLNTNMDKFLLVKGWSSRSCWGFPKGKINKHEPEMACAIREVREETGYEIGTDRINLEDCLLTRIQQQQIKLFIVTDVPEDYPFVTHTRNEISDIKWHSIPDVNRIPPKSPNNAPGINKQYNQFFLVIPFMQDLNGWIAQRRQVNSAKVKI